MRRFDESAVGPAIVIGLCLLGVALCLLGGALWPKAS